MAAIGAMRRRPTCRNEQYRHDRAVYFDDGTAHVTAVDRHKLDDIQPYIFKRSDGGKSWTRLDAGFALAGAVVHAVREDPVEARAFSMPEPKRACSCPSTTARRLAKPATEPTATARARPVVKDNDLVVATHGRSF